MKKITFLILLFFPVSIGWTQNIDSLLAVSQVIKLSISTPQPRLNETFQVSIDANHLRSNIFKSLAGKMELNDGIMNSENAEITMNVNAVKKGIYEIGPLEFYLDKTKYTTNKITYEVVDPLPKTDHGLWFRKVTTSDSTFCIIIDQRIPASNKTTKSSDNSITLTTEPEHKDLVKLGESYSINGIERPNSHSYSSFSSVTINGEDRQFMYGFSVYYFKIVDKKAKIRITKNGLENLPVDYKFEDIVVQ